VDPRDASEVVELREYFADKIYVGASQRRRMCLTRSPFGTPKPQWTSSPGCSPAPSHPRPSSHLTTWRPWSVTHRADMRRAGAVLEAARDITVRGESPAHRPSGRPRTSSRARPPGRRPGAGWPERPMPRRGQSSPGLVRVGIARNALHRHLLARHSGRYDAEPARGQGLTVQTGPRLRGLRRRARSSSCDCDPNRPVKRQ